MKQLSRWFTIFFFTVAVSSSAIFSQNNATKKDVQQKKEISNAAVQYTCRMHPDIRADKPGVCPKCGMELVAVNRQSKEGMKEMPMERKHDTSTMKEMKHDTTPPKNKKRDMKALMDKKFALMKAEKYHCCIDGACNECVDEGECNCRKAVQNDKPVCNECYKGWKEGDGMVPGKTLKDIRHEGHEHKD